MNKFKKIIFIVYILLFLNLVFSKSLFSTVTIFLVINSLLSIFTKLKQKIINRILFFELVLWIINSFWILSNQIDLWFLSLNNLLWLLTSIKLIEVKNNINTKNIIFLLLLSIGTSSLFNVSFIGNLILIISLFLLLYSLLVFNKYKSENIIKQIIILITFLPLTLISFTNIPSPKPWLNFNSKNFAKTGISNELRPGDISSLAKSEDLVGRVFFSESLPKTEDRYWRVHVLDDFENNAWLSSDNNKLILPKNILENNNSQVSNNERWILEPSYIKERPWSGNRNKTNSDLLITEKGVLLGSKELKKREQYKITFPYNSWKKVPPKITNKSFEEIKNKKLYALSRKWLMESSNKKEIVEKAKNFFKNENLIYSINPGLMNNSYPYDDFLFRKKKGFCEHFAGSFALLMRYAEIPVRVVIGYQGGETLSNSQDKNFLLIDNSYAHAWTEIWIENEGWLRIDPTSWVSPERIRDSSLLVNNENTNFTNLKKFFNLQFASNLTKLELNLDNILNKVTKKLGLFSFSKNIIINRVFSLLYLFAIILFSVLWISLLEIKTKKNLIRLSIDTYLYLLNIYNFKIKDGETLKSFSLKIAKIYPEIKKEIKEIYLTYYFYKFKGKKISYLKNLSIFFRITLNEFKVLTFIKKENISHRFKFLKSKK